MINIMFYFCLVNEYKVKEQIASFPSIFLARKNICFIKARHFRERGNPRAWGGWLAGAGVMPGWVRRRASV